MTSKKNPVPKLFDAIRAYANVYAAFQTIQDQHKGFLQVGDQKTGVIGEFYALLYASSIYPKAYVKLSETPCDPRADIVVEGPTKYHIQVKTVSAYSTTRRIEFKKPPCADFLYILSLDHELRPDGFWVIKKGAQKIQRSLRVPHKQKGVILAKQWEENDKIESLLAVLREHKRI